MFLMRLVVGIQISSLSFYIVQTYVKLFINFKMQNTIIVIVYYQ